MIAPIPMRMVANEESYRDLFQLDEVVMVGYPDSICDEYNNQPIFRRGVLATNPSLDYNGKKQFLIDIAAFNGSSGSPILLMREGVCYDRKPGNANLIHHPSFQILGVLFAGYQHEIDGRIVVVPVPTSSVPIPLSRIPNNLGIVIKAQRIRELEELVNRIV